MLGGDTVHKGPKKFVRYQIRNGSLEGGEFPPIPPLAHLCFYVKITPSSRHVEKQSKNWQRRPALRWFYVEFTPIIRFFAN